MPAKRDEPTRIIVPIPRKLLQEIDDFRWANRLPSRAEAIRQLIKAGLQAKKPK